MKELIKHLSILKRQGVIRDWHDRQITAGTEWEGQIDEHLNSAQVILLLISPDFIASDYCYDIELVRAMERHENKTARVIPVILRPVDWKGAPFGKLQSLPKDAKPITSWTNQDEAFLNVAQGIRQAIEQIRQLNPSPSDRQVSSNASGIHRSASQQRRIQKEIESLQQMHDLLSEKLQRLRRDWATQAGSAIAFQLEKEIEQAEAERAKIEERLGKLER